MIVFSLVLILVAVALLVLGLTAGSSTLLIASIAASLLAAIALVIGARRAATARRAAASGNPEPGYAGQVYAEPPFAEPVASGPRQTRRRAASDVVGTGNTPAGAGDLTFETMGTGNTPAGAATETVAGPDHAEAAAYAAGRRDAEDELSYPDEPILDFTDDPLPPPLAEEPPEAHRAESAEQPDYDRAAEFIGGARAPEQSRDSIWDDPAETPVATAAASAAAASAAEPLTDDPGLPGELAEAEPDDPADEPRAQTVRPGDAVRVARMDNEVLVVDGRPRYHLADCPHLISKQTEGLSVAEAVELGFTPCGLCRPVDRLVAAAARG
jgi:hypothetical protein